MMFGRPSVTLTWPIDPVTGKVQTDHAPDGRRPGSGRGDHLPGAEPAPGRLDDEAAAIPGDGADGGIGKEARAVLARRVHMRRRYQQRIGETLAHEEAAPDHMLTEIRREAQYAGAVVDLAHHAERVLRGNLPFDELHLVGRFRDPEATAQPNAAVGAEPLLHRGPALLRLAYQLDGRPDAVDPVVREMRVDVDLEVQAPRVGAGSLAIEVAALDHRDVDAALCEIVRGRAADEAGAYDGDIRRAKHALRSCPVSETDLSLDPHPLGGKGDAGAAAGLAIDDDKAIEADPHAAEDPARRAGDRRDAQRAAASGE